ncbi:MAG: acetoacetate decarboxylase family protein [Thermodesulfobacteriota bacterium]
MKRTAFKIVLSAFIGLVGSFSQGMLPEKAQAQGFMYQEFDGVYLYYTPQDTAVYRELLPPVFDLPDQPLIWGFVVDYYKMAPWSLEPYQEVAIFLLGKYKGEEVWHCITMPVTSERARIGGIRNLGYPKVLADIVFTRQEPIFSGTLKAGGKTLLEVTLDTKDRTVSDKEREWFKRLTGIPSLNFRNGKLIDPVPAARKARTNLLELSEKMAGTFKVQVGRAVIKGSPEAVPTDPDWRPKAFGIKAKEIVLAYYFQNRYGFSFGVPKQVSE